MKLVCVPSSSSGTIDKVQISASTSFNKKFVTIFNRPEKFVYFVTWSIIFRNLKSLFKNLNVHLWRHRIDCKSYFRKWVVSCQGSIPGSFTHDNNNRMKSDQMLTYCTVQISPNFIQCFDNFYGSKNLRYNSTQHRFFQLLIIVPNSKMSKY